MLKWSKYIQNPDYLSAYRIMTLDQDYLPLISKWIRLRNGYRVLDAGCGTGAFTFFLASFTNSCEYYGIDIDQDFIDAAKNNAELKSLSSNRFVFQTCDALRLPFPDEYFDVVTSYTFLTNVHNGSAVMKELTRVLKKNCYLSSITAQSFEERIGFDGSYPASHTHYYYELKALRSKVEQAYRMIQPLNDYSRVATIPEKIPRLYANSGLTHIEMHPLGWSFSLSDDSRQLSEKERYIQLRRIAEEKKVLSYSELEKFSQLITPSEVKRYVELLRKQEEVLLKSLGENSIWEWCGGSQLLMCAMKLL